MINIEAFFIKVVILFPEYPDNKPMVDKDHPLLYFADVCAGPGGFSEYVLWRKKCKSKGFGFTLRGQNDFKLEDFFAGPRKSDFYGFFSLTSSFISVNMLNLTTNSLKVKKLKVTLSIARISLAGTLIL